MCQRANVNTFIIIIISLVAFLSRRSASSSKFESFLPSLINIIPEIQMRSNSNRNISTTLIDLKNFAFMIYPQTCGECNGFLIIIAIESYVANFESRKVIRETWAIPMNCIKILFFIGTTYDTNIMRRISDESLKHRDIVQGKIEDTYRSLPYKHLMALKWAHTYCNHAKYVIKTDADTIVKLDNLYALLEKDTWGSKRLIAGYVEKHEKVLRDVHSTMKSRIVSLKEYKETYYPTYCWGQFIIYSSDIVPYLLEESTKVPYFKIEDIYVTGLLAKNIKGVRHVNLVPDWYLSRASLHNLTLYFSKKNYVYGPYSLSPEEMRQTWKLIQESQKLERFIQ